MKSSKRIKELSEIVNPYTITPPLEIFIGVNGKNIYCPINKTTSLTYAEFESLLYSDFSKYL